MRARSTSPPRNFTELGRLDRSPEFRPRSAATPTHPRRAPKVAAFAPPVLCRSRAPDPGLDRDAGKRDTDPAHLRFVRRWTRPPGKRRQQKPTPAAAATQPGTPPRTARRTPARRRRGRRRRPRDRRGARSRRHETSPSPRGLGGRRACRWSRSPVSGGSARPASRCRGSHCPTRPEAPMRGRRPRCRRSRARAATPRARSRANRSSGSR